MCRRLVMGLLSVSVIAVLPALVATEASAGWCSKPPCAGVKWFGGSCICCGTGSETFQINARGVPGSLVNNCPVGRNCLKCSVFGTVGNNCATNLDPTCGVEGVVFCENPAGHFNPQGQPFIMDSVVSAQGNFTNCSRAGKCEGNIVVHAGLPPDVCINPNWRALTFTASRFNGSCCFCDIGYEEDGTCLGTETCTAEGFRCAIDSVPPPGTVSSYQCCLFSELNAQGVCPQS